MPPKPWTTNARTGAELGQHVGQRPDERGGEDPDDLRARAGRVGQRAEHVEDRPRAELAAHRRRHGASPGWCAGANMKPKPSSSIDAAMRSGGSSSRKPSASSTSAEPDADDIARLPCLATRGACSRGDERGGGRDVERVRAVATRAGRVDEVVARRVDRAATCARMPSAQPGDLVDGLALRAERDEEAGDLGRRRLAAHDRVHHLARLVARQVATVEQPWRSPRWITERKLSNHARPVRREDRLGVELDALDREDGVPDAHHLAVGACATVTTRSEGTATAASEW